MRGERLRNTLFVMLMAALAGMVGMFASRATWPRTGFKTAEWLALAVAGLGIALTVSAYRAREARAGRLALMATGVSAAAIPASVVLHNLVYVLLKALFGPGFWDRHGTDEPVFFILALVVFPVLVVASASAAAFAMFWSRFHRPPV